MTKIEMWKSIDLEVYTSINAESTPWYTTRYTLCLEVRSYRLSQSWGSRHVVEVVENAPGYGGEALAESKRRLWAEFGQWLGEQYTDEHSNIWKMEHST